MKKNLRKKIRMALLAFALLLGLAFFGLWAYFFSKETPVVVMLETMQDYREVYALKDRLKAYHIVWHPMPEFMFDFKGEYPDKKALLEAKENPMFLAQSHDSERYSALCHLDLRVDFPWRELERCEKQGAKGVIVYNFYVDGYEAQPENIALFKEKMLESKMFLVMPFANKSSAVMEKEIQRYAPVPFYCPYWCSKAYDLKQLDQWLDAYPHLFIGTGFGAQSKKGVQWMQDQSKTLEVFLESHASRFLFETDLALNFEEPYLFYAQYLHEWRAFWTGKNFESQAILPGEPLKGLDLSRKTQKKILFQNASRLLQWE